MDVTHCAVPAVMSNVSMSFGSAGDRTVWFKMARNAPASTTPMMVSSLRVALCCCAATGCSAFKTWSLPFFGKIRRRQGVRMRLRTAIERNARRFACADARSRRAPTALRALCGWKDWWGSKKAAAYHSMFERDVVASARRRGKAVIRGTPSTCLPARVLRHRVASKLRREALSCRLTPVVARAGSALSRLVSFKYSEVKIPRIFEKFRRSNELHMTAEPSWNRGRDPAPTGAGALGGARRSCAWGERARSQEGRQRKGGRSRRRVAGTGRRSARHGRRRAAPGTIRPCAPPRTGRAARSRRPPGRTRRRLPGWWDRRAAARS